MNAVLSITSFGLDDAFVDNKIEYVKTWLNPMMCCYALFSQPIK